MNENFPAILTGVLFLVVGVLGLFFPYKIQAYYIKCLKENKFMNNFSIDTSSLESKDYIWSLRIIGVVGIAVFLLSIYVSFE